MAQSTHSPNSIIPQPVFASRSPLYFLTRTIFGISTLCGVLASLMILAAIVITCEMIWVRSVMNSSTTWQTESVVYLVLGATMIGLPYVQLVRGHVNIDLLPRLLPPRLRLILAVTTIGLAIVVMGIMTYYSFEMWHLAWSRGWTSSTIWGPQLWVPYLALPLGFGLYVLQLVADLLAVLAGAAPPFDISSSEEG
ncbi:MAG: TRAP transporter small permease subunit [Candidatus Competibacterales bacterium]